MKHVMEMIRYPITQTRKPEILVCRTHISPITGEGNHLVFRMRNERIRNPEYADWKAQCFPLQQEMKSDQLPWCRSTPAVPG